MSPRAPRKSVPTLPTGRSAGRLSFRGGVRGTHPPTPSWRKLAIAGAKARVQVRYSRRERKLEPARHSWELLVFAGARLA